MDHPSTAVRFKRLARLIPGVRLGSDRWSGVIFVSVFYVYALAVIVSWSAFLQLLRSSADRMGAVAVLAGLLGLYLASTLPQLLRGSRRERAYAGAARRFHANKLAVIGLIVFLLFFTASLLAPLIAPYEPMVQEAPALERYQAPTRDHLLGTDKFGRDILSRILYGARVSLTVGLSAVLLASLFGMVFGAFSGYLGGRIDDALMRVVDGFLAFPRLLLVLTLLAFFSNSLLLIVLVLAGTGWMGVCRLVRAEVLSLRESDFIQAAVATGLGRVRIVWKHLVPNTLGPVVVTATLKIGTIILLESYLSFLGIGVQPPTASWGNMVFEGRDVLLSAWWVSAFPGLAIAATVVSCNLLGDGLRDSLDVKLSG
jgi:peptide/nickel transport system permease protein